MGIHNVFSCRIKDDDPDTLGTGEKGERLCKVEYRVEKGWTDIFSRAMTRDRCILVFRIFLCHQKGSWQGLIVA